MIHTIFILLGVFQLKHFIADFPLQNNYMLKKMGKTGWIIPLASHALVHAAMTFVIVMTVKPSLWWLAIVDFVVHFSVDRVKASPYMLNRWGVDNKYFWWSLGGDQMAHHLTHYYFIYMIISS